jgi:hypothetical protein
VVIIFDNITVENNFMRKPNIRPLAPAFLFYLILSSTNPAKAASYTWTNTAGGNWNVAANWSPNGVPGGTDSAAITTTGSYTVTMSDTESVGTLTLGASSGDATAQTLNLSSGTFTLNNASTGTAQGMLNLSGATLEGAGPLTLAGPFNWTGGALMAFVQFKGGSINGGLNFYGALVNSGTLAWNGTLYVYGGVLTNLASGTINLAAGSLAASESGSPDFVNDGRINASGTGASSIGIPFNNYGTVDVNSGTLSLGNGGTESNSFTVESGATLQLGGGTFTFSSGSTILGAGNFTVSGGTAGLAGICNVMGTYTVSGGVANVTGDSTIAGPLVLSGGTLNLNSGEITPPTATFSGGTEAGTQIVHVSLFTWDGTAIYGNVRFYGGSINGGLNLYGTLINSGTLAWNGTVYMYGGTLTNMPSGTINFAAGSGVSGVSGSPFLENVGRFIASGPGTSYIGLPFNNLGTVAVNSGTLNLEASGTEIGSFTVASGATLNMGGDTYTFISGSTISGAGNLTVSAGTVGFGGTSDVTGTNTFSGGVANVTGACTITSALVISGGTLNLNGSGAITPATATIVGGTEEGSQPIKVQSAGGFTWAGGLIYGLVQFNGGTVNADGGQNLSGALVNSGTLAWSGTVFMYGGVFTNLASGTVNLAPQSSVTAISGSPDLDNDGQFNVSGPGTSTIGIPFNNHGSVNIQSGVLSLTGPQSLTNGTLNFAITNTTSFGTLNLSGNADLTCTLGATITGFAPQIGDSFGLITYGSETGLFSAFNLPSDVNWGFNYGNTLFSLIVSNLAAPYLTLQIVEPPLVTDGFTLLMLGPIGSNYSIQAAAAPNLTNWVSLTNFTSVDTSFYYTDTTATNHQARVFRAVMH